MKEIGVSVLCLTYNQEKYIKQCLESLIMQKTNFPFEVIINDDASTDKTPEIIKEYVDKYPNIIKPIYQKENQYSKGVAIMDNFLFPSAKGKYIAFCEGDDFWTDENKLQMQFDAMEKNLNCHLCVHKVQFISENGKELKKKLPSFNLNKKIITAEEFIKIIMSSMCFHINCCFVRKKDYTNYINDFKIIRQMFIEQGCGDIPKLCYFGQLNNNIFYIDKIMSVYRMNVLGSWTLKNENLSSDIKVKNNEHIINAIEKIDIYTSYKYHKSFLRKIFSHSIQIAKNHTNRKDLLLKNRKEFFGRFNFFQKLILLIYILFPNLATRLREIYRIFKY